MQLLTIPAMTAPADDSWMSQGGLVDRQTAAADCVVLWTDAPRSPEFVTGDAAACPVCATDHRAQ